MIFFGTCVGFPDKFQRYSEPSVAKVMQGEDYCYYSPRSDGKDLFRTYRTIRNMTHDRLAIWKDQVEALVLLHDDLELLDPSFSEKVRTVFQDPEVAIIGCIGAKGVTSLNWWEGQGRGYCVDGRNGRTVVDFGFPEGDPCEVDTVDGMLLILSPWAIQNLTLPPEYYGFHGYPEELCFQARAKGKKVVVTRLDVFHHTQGGIVGGSEGYERSNKLFQSRYGL